MEAEKSHAAITAQTARGLMILAEGGHVLQLRCVRRDGPIHLDAFRHQDARLTPLAQLYHQLAVTVQSTNQANNVTSVLATDHFLQPAVQRVKFKRQLLIHFAETEK